MTPSVPGAVLMVVLAVLVLGVDVADRMLRPIDEAPTTRLPALLDLLIAGIALLDAGLVIAADLVRSMLWALGSACLVLAAYGAGRGFRSGTSRSHRAMPTMEDVPIRSTTRRSTTMRRRIAIAAAGTAIVLSVGGAGLAFASTASVPAAPASPAAVTGPAADVPEPGDTPDVPGQPDAQDTADAGNSGAPDVPEPGDTPDAPGQN